MAYKIKSGDTLSQIAKDNNTTVQAIMDLNPSITNPNKIFAGNTINLPSSGASSSAPSSAGSTSLNANKGSNSTNLNFGGSKPEGWSEEHWNTAANALSKYNEASAYLENELKAIYGDTTPNDIVKQILERESFSYDFANDPLFQNALSSYQQMGNTAMKDTIAQSSALTGGYANSWAQTAGQQTYNQHIQNAFENLPSYYQMALSTYQQEGQNLKDKYSIASAERDRAVSEIMTLGNLKKKDAEKIYDTAMELGRISYDDHWKNKDYDYKVEQDSIANNRAAQSLAMQEAEMKANGYVKKADGSWEYVGGDDPYAFMDYYYEGAKAAKEEGDYALYEYFYKLPISDSEKSALLSSIGKANDFMQYYDPISDIKEMLRDPTLSAREQNELKNRILARYEGTPEYERVKKALQ